jgi:hypothetical protein
LVVYFLLAERGFVTIVLALLQLKQYKMDEGEALRATGAGTTHCISAQTVELVPWGAERVFCVADRN